METKCMLAIERKGIPFDCSLPSARQREVKLVEGTLEWVLVLRKQGRPRKRLEKLAADRAYDTTDCLRGRLHRKEVRPYVHHGRTARTTQIRGGSSLY